MFPHASRKRLISAVAIASAFALLGACSSTSTPDAPATSGAAGSSAAAETPKGDLLVLTWRTDLNEDGTFAKYKAAFEAKYPEVKVEFEAIKDYEGEVRTRMNTDDYGDVLGIVGTIQPKQYPDFFEPLGNVDELEKTYRFLRDKTFDGKTYGIPVVGNTQGIVYNKLVWEAAGLKDYATTPAEFVADLQAIKDKTDAIPMYTNYHDGWPVTQWDGHRGEVTADPDFTNKMAKDDAPWTAGKDMYEIDSLLWDIVSNKLIEDDPTTTEWEGSKSLLAQGKIGTMVLGSWAISQMKEAAVKEGKSADDIGYMPFPFQVDGKFHASVGGDYNQAINVHSKNKVAARAWIDWFNNESGFADAQGGLSPLKDSPEPSTLADFKTAGVEYVVQTPAASGEESLWLDIDKESAIGVQQPEYRQRLIDDARGQTKETKDELFADLNAKWKDARAAVAG